MLGVWESRGVILSRVTVSWASLPKVTAPKVTAPKVTAPRVTLPRITAPTVARSFGTCGGQFHGELRVAQPLGELAGAMFCVEHGVPPRSAAGIEPRGWDRPWHPVDHLQGPLPGVDRAVVPIAQ